MDTLTATYFVAFVAGGGLGVVSWALGHLGHGHAHGHHGHGHAHAHAHADVLNRWLLGPLLNITSIAALACVGGGLGFLSRRMGAGAIASLLAAVPAGLVAAYGLGALSAWLARTTHYAEPLPEAVVGTVLARIGEGTTGEVMYLHQGARASLPARSADGTPIEAGVEVVVLGIEDGIARVTPTALLLEREKRT